MPRQIAFVIRCMRASVAFFFVSSSDENRRTARAALPGLGTAARAGARSMARLITAGGALGREPDLWDRERGLGLVGEGAQPWGAALFSPKKSSDARAGCRPTVWVWVVV